MAFWLGIMTILGEIFMPELMVVLAPGFAEDPAKFALAVSLSQDNLSLSRPDLPRRAGFGRSERPGEIHRGIGVLCAVQHRLDRLHDLDDALCSDRWSRAVLGRDDLRCRAAWAC